MSGNHFQENENSRNLRPASRAYHVSKLLAQENALPSIKRLKHGKPALFAYDQVQLQESALLESKASELKSQHWQTVSSIVPALGTVCSCLDFYRNPCFMRSNLACETDRSHLGKPGARTVFEGRCHHQSRQYWK